MKATFLKGVVLGSVVSLVMLAATAAFAGSGVGGVFNLGKYNGANGTTTLAGSTAGNQLNVVNTSTGAGAAGIGISVHSNKPPLVVNSATQVKNLNSSYLQGMKASQFVQGPGSAHGGTVTVPSTGFTGMGAVGSFGGMTAYCETGGFASAGIMFDTTIPQTIYVWDTLTGMRYYVLGGSGRADIARNSDVAMATVQFVSGTEVATATLTWVDTAGTCDFSAHVVDSHG